MAFRPRVSLVLGMVLTCVGWRAYAADCVAVRHDYDDLGRMIEVVSIAGSADDRSVCGPLKVTFRRRDDTRSNIEIWASYAGFDPARTEGEQRYNQWIKRELDRLTLDGPLEDYGAYKVLNTMTLLALYRSSQLLSATVGNSYGCGAHCGYLVRSLNIDPTTGRNVYLGELVRLAQVANFCWQQFSNIDSSGRQQGAAFAQYYPLEEEFSDRDFAMEPKTISRMRSSSTSELFANTLLSSDRWSAGQHRLTIYFGELVGYWAGHFNCVIDEHELGQFTKPGVSVPP